MYIYDKEMYFMLIFRHEATTSTDKIVRKLHSHAPRETLISLLKIKRKEKKFGCWHALNLDDSAGVTDHGVCEDVRECRIEGRSQLKNYLRYSFFFFYLQCIVY